MTEPFFDSLTARAHRIDSLLCIGLDPRANSAAAAREACLRIIEATAQFAAAFKPNAAFFEALGPEGWSALREVIARVPPGIPVILDAKRGDIADTAQAYARSAFDELGAQAITASPYLGGESLTPFLNRPECGVFVLCKTSNPGADELQSLPVVGAIHEPVVRAIHELPLQLYEYVAQRAQTWSRHDNVGLVVGATDPAALERVRAMAPGLWFLVPGVGAQGGDLAAALRAGLRADGLGMLINVSRAVAAAPDAAEAARQWRDEIRAGVRSQESEVGSRGSEVSSPATHRGSGIQSSTSDLQVLAADLVASGCVRFGAFTLKSGQTSPIYLDLRRLVTYPAILRRVAQAYAEILRGLEFDRIAGIPYAALPIATAISLEMDRPLIYPRREVKDYGTKAGIEGVFAAGETAVLIDDLATTGETKIEAIERLEAAGLTVRDIVVLIDREQGAGEYLAARGYRYHAVAGLRALLAEWRRSGAIDERQHAEVEVFLSR
ncbi:MAG: orotidine-5'-phosphate decarboxylase [Chloroflexi bacterium]|nr:orotidine-5'-phosphate decarboxylase [Chloroflexota bacterium]